MEDEVAKFHTISLDAQRQILAFGGVPFLRAPAWAQNWFIDMGFCAWGCGCFLTFHEPDDRVCIERCVARYEGVPEDCSRVYLPRPAMDRAVAKGLSDTDFADEGDGYFSVVVRVDKDGTQAYIGGHARDERGRE